MADIIKDVKFGGEISREDRRAIALHEFAAAADGGLAPAELKKKMEELREAIPDAVAPPESGDLGFEDLEAAFNMRGWLQKACEAAGGKMTGGGLGCGCADIWIELEGHEYMVTIKPVKK